MSYFVTILRIICVSFEHWDTHSHQSLTATL